MRSRFRRILSPHQLLLLAILVGSLVLRLWGSGFGLPAFAHYHPDEHVLIDRAILILQTGNWDPQRFNYPPFYAYIHVPLYAACILHGRLLGWWEQVPAFPLPQYYHLARLATASFATLTVLAVSTIGRQLFSRRAGLLAAALLGGNYLHTIHSHYATLDVMVTFLVALCLLFSARALTRDRMASYALAGICAGLAGATKYNGALSLLLPLTVLALLWRRNTLNARIKRLAVIVTGFALAFVGGNPFALFSWDAFLDGVGTVWQHYSTGQPGFEGLGNWRWYLHILVTSADGAWAIAGTVGLLAVLRSHLRQGLLLILFPIAYFWLVAGFVVRFERNVLPLLPFLALGGGWLLCSLAGWLSRGRSKPIASSRGPAASTCLSWQVGQGGAVLLLALPLIASIGFDILLSRTDHRELAGRWLEQNVEGGAQIGIEHYAIPFNHEPYEVTDLVRMSDHDLAWYRQAGYDLLIVSDGIWEVLRQQPQYYGDKLEILAELMAGTTLLAEFVPDPPGIVVAGYPSVAVYHFAPVRIFSLSQ